MVESTSLRAAEVAAVKDSIHATVLIPPGGGQIFEEVRSGTPGGLLRLSSFQVWGIWPGRSSLVLEWMLLFLVLSFRFLTRLWRE